jgi:hypothetical protein
MSTWGHEVLLSTPYCFEAKFFSIDDQIRPAIALLEIEHKQFPLGRLQFALRKGE